MVAKASDQVDGDKPSTKARASRKAATKPTAAATKDTGASAPVSAGATAPDTPAPAAGAVIDTDQISQGMAMGRFPPDWKPAPAVVVEEGDGEQTGAEEGFSSTAQSSVWEMPVIADFPATLTLNNKTPARVRLLALRGRALPWSEQTVQCLTAEQYLALQRELSAQAKTRRWTSENGLQVTHEQN